MIWLTGDVNFCDGYFDAGIGTGSLIGRGLDPFAHLYRKPEDYWIANFEGVCSDSSELTGAAAEQFIISPAALSRLRHPDLYGVANNHVMQHGAEAYRQMLANLESLGCDYVGSDQRRTFRFEHQGRTVGVAAFNQRPENFKFGTLYWADPELSEIAAEFDKSMKDADYRIAYLHWGFEFMDFPTLDQRRFAHWLVDLGFDLVVGMHPHVLQGFEVYRGRHIFYSLGNTVFDMAWYKTRYGALVSVDLSQPEPKVGYRYIKIDDRFSPVPVEEADVPEDCRFPHLNRLIEHNLENEKYFRRLFGNMKRYRRANYRKIAGDMARMKPSALLPMLAGFAKRKLGR